MSNKVAGTIYVITHCESCYNKEGIFTGRKDIELSPDGHNHAKRLGEQLKDIKLDVAYITSLKRTRETLDHIAKYHHKMKVIVDERMIERGYGLLEGRIKEKYAKENPDLYKIYHRSYDVPPPGGESMVEVEKRVMKFVREVIALIKKKNINVLIVAHSNSIRPIRRYFEKLSPEEMMKLDNLRHKIFIYNIFY